MEQIESTIGVLTLDHGLYYMAQEPYDAPGLTGTLVRHVSPEVTIASKKKEAGLLKIL